MTVGRIRVLVAGDISVNRSLVRPFLEDDGYEVVAETFTRDDVLPSVSRLQPDAVVIDDRLLPARRNGKLLQRVRQAAPDAKVVVFTAAAARKPNREADASLERGTGLAALSALLGRLLADESPRAALAGVGAAAGSAGTVKPSDPRGGVTRFVVSVGAPILVVWALIAMITTDGGAPVPPADTTDIAGQVVIVPQGIGPLDDAHDSLERMIAAIEAGNYVVATLHARELMFQRETAAAAGYLTIGLDREIRAALSTVAGPLPVGAIASLQDVLGHLFPTLESEPTPGGGSTIILGAVIGAGSGDSATSGGGGGGGDTTGGGGSGSGEGDGGTVVALGPGDGREWGHSHQETRGDDGPPPWANGHSEDHGHRGDPPGHDDDAHGNGQGIGHGHGGQEAGGVGTDA